MDIDRLCAKIEADLEAHYYVSGMATNLIASASYDHTRRLVSSAIRRTVKATVKELEAEVKAGDDFPKVRAAYKVLITTAFTVALVSTLIGLAFTPWRQACGL